ncbi:MAG: DUF4870 domain-containing protein [Candidatus Euphemobacter frigidus]|nr:DUF4870 domain-containing protein [Candidatus Euphemobacter frigidus]MDP8276725.1 DUF4870 domain-containing protein [Candidatus Euphemobacter frigidus]
MNDERAQPTSDPEAITPVPKPSPPAPDSREVEEGKVFAILSYALSIIGLPFFLIPLIMRNNEFSLYHAKQTLIIWLAGIAAGIVSGILSFICIGIVLGVAAAIFLLVLTIMGLINAAQGEEKPLPLIGQWGEEWFKGITKV